MKARVEDRDLGWKKILASALAVAAGADVKVGILGDNERGGLHRKEPDGKASPLTVAETAVVNEFGTEDGSIPARPAHRMAFDAARSELEARSRQIIVAIVLDQKLTVEQGLNILGLILATKIKNFITTQSGELVPNAPSTVLAKVPASSKGAVRQRAIDGARPLVDHGTTVNAISWAVTIASLEKPAKYLPGSKATE